MKASDIEKLANLAKLTISDDTVSEVANRITQVLTLVDQLQDADTEGVSPMAHPLDATQKLRRDNVTEVDQRLRFQQIAPETENGLYLVPKVIE